MAQILTVEPTLQVRIMAAVFALNHLLGFADALFGQLRAGQQAQQQIKDLALILGRSFDHKGGIGAAGKGVPFATQRLHTLLKASFAGVVDATEQQMLQQVRQLLIGTRKIVQANPHHQADGHMIAVIVGFQDQLQPIGQLVALDAVSIQGKALSSAKQQADKQQATHKKSLNSRIPEPVQLSRCITADNSPMHNVQGECCVSAASSSSRAPVSEVSSTTYALPQNSEFRRFISAISSRCMELVSILCVTLRCKRLT